MSDLKYVSIEYLTGVSRVILILMGEQKKGEKCAGERYHDNSMSWYLQWTEIAYRKAKIPDSRERVSVISQTIRIHKLLEFLN